jgi:bifunctional non-homologous end joining protein LigD
VPAERATPAKRQTKRRTKNPSFVIQEHHARQLHWDLRLERDGVYVSWAVPKGLPPDQGTNHLAVHVEDHPLEYGSFEGTIPKGEYGAGEVRIWDSGTYEAPVWTDREVKFHLHGSRVDARYALFQTDGDNWMVHRMDPAPSGWEPLPELVRPMLAVPGDLPEDESGWSYEFKWDGVRALAYVEGGRARLVGRNDRDCTDTYPELRGLGEALGSRQAVLDGEVIALDEHGRPSFEALQPRMHVADAARARRLAQRAPVTYFVFDLLHLDGDSTLDLPYAERRRRLEGLGLAGDRWVVPSTHPGPGADLLAAARSAGLEGVVAKRSASPYRPGRRSSDWVKVKVTRTQEVVIGGWSPGKGGRAQRIGALLVGIPEEGGLRYAGKVGTGFSDATLADLGARLAPLERPTSPFAECLPATEAGGATWVEPALVGEVRFTEWTLSGRLRHPVWRGLRGDKTPVEVTRES